MKQLKVVFSLLLVALLLAGCGTKDTKNVDAAKAADDLKSALTFQDELLRQPRSCATGRMASRRMMWYRASCI